MRHVFFEVAHIIILVVNYLRSDGGFVLRAHLRLCNGWFHLLPPKICFRQLRCFPTHLLWIISYENIPPLCTGMLCTRKSFFILTQLACCEKILWIFFFRGWIGRHRCLQRQQRALWYSVEVPPRLDRPSEFYYCSNRKFRTLGVNTFERLELY